MTRYYIFKTVFPTGNTTLICGGIHDTKEECSRHWRAYMYGFMDAASEIIGSGSFEMKNGYREMSFLLTSAAIDGSVEYFMLLDDEGRNLFQVISKKEISKED